MYAYDKVGNRLSLSDPVNNLTSWAYDGLNRVTQETNDLNAHRYFEYDAAGNLTQKTDRNGRVTQYAYDALDRLVNEFWIDGHTVARTFTNVYDAAGQLTEASDHDAVGLVAKYTYEYDGWGHVKQVSNAGTPGVPTVVLTSQYDIMLNREWVKATIASTADFQNDFTYDGQNRLTRVRQHSQSGGNSVADKRTNFTYNAAGQFSSVQRQYDNSGWTEIATSAYTYDSVGRLEQLAHTRAAGVTDIVTYAWTFDAADRILSFTNSTHSAENVTAYDYDDTNQVTGTDYASAVDEVFAYDANGNREEVTTNYAGTQEYDPAENNRVTNDGVFTYIYDDEGNRISRTRIVPGSALDAVTLYTWDHRNRLVRVVNKNSGGAVTMHADYTYDVYNHRIGKVIDWDGDLGSDPIETVRFVYDRDQIALQFSGSTSSSLTHRYLYGPAVDMLLADEQTTSASAGTIQTPLGDHLGTVHDVVATNGTVGYHAVYDTFGNVTSSTGLTSILFGFTSQAYDTETGLSYHWNRYYDVIVGSWISEDPIGFAAGDMNIRRYVGNSPFMHRDWSGLAIGDANEKTEMPKHFDEKFIEITPEAMRRAGIDDSDELDRLNALCRETFSDKHVMKPEDALFHVTSVKIDSAAKAPIRPATSTFLINRRGGEPSYKRYGGDPIKLHFAWLIIKGYWTYQCCEGEVKTEVQRTEEKEYKTKYHVPFWNDYHDAKDKVKKWADSQKKEGETWLPGEIAHTTAGGPRKQVLWRWVDERPKGPFGK